jgi:hypothetical protein
LAENPELRKKIPHSNTKVTAEEADYAQIRAATAEDQGAHDLLSRQYLQAVFNP